MNKFLQTILKVLGIILVAATISLIASYIAMAVGEEQPIRFGGTGNNGSGYVTNGMMWYDGTSITSTPAVKLINSVLTAITETVGSLTATSSLEAPTSSSVSLTRTGQIAIDTTVGQFRFHDGSGDRALTATGSIPINLDAPSDTDDNKMVWRAPFDFTVYDANCSTDIGTTTITVEDNSGNACSPVLLCGPNGTSTAMTNCSFTSLETIRIDTSNTTGTPGQMNANLNLRLDLK